MTKKGSPDTRAQRGDGAAPVEGRYLTVRETAQLLKLSEISIRRLLTQKRLRRFKCGSRTLILLSDAEALVHEA